MSEPTRGNKGTGQAPDEAKGVTGADGAASTNGRQNGRPDFVEGSQAARTAATTAREQEAKESGPQAHAAGRWIRTAATASGQRPQSDSDCPAQGAQ